MSKYGIYHKLQHAYVQCNEHAWATVLTLQMYNQLKSFWPKVSDVIKHGNKACQEDSQSEMYKTIAIAMLRQYFHLESDLSLECYFDCNIVPVFECKLVRTSCWYENSLISGYCLETVFDLVKRYLSRYDNLRVLFDAVVTQYCQSEYQKFKHQFRFRKRILKFLQQQGGVKLPERRNTSDKKLPPLHLSIIIDETPCVAMTKSIRDYVDSRGVSFNVFHAKDKQGKVHRMFFAKHRYSDCEPGTKYIISDFDGYCENTTTYCCVIESEDKLLRLKN